MRMLELVGQKVAEPKCPEFLAPNFAPKFLPIFSRIFRVLFFLGNGDHRRFAKYLHKMPHSQANSKENPQSLLERAHQGIDLLELQTDMVTKNGQIERQGLHARKLSLRDCRMWPQASLGSTPAFGSGMGENQRYQQVDDVGRCNVQLVMGLSHLKLLWLPPE